MYRERMSIVDGAVLWHRVAASGGRSRVLPDGCMDLIWSDGALLVAGPDTRAHWVTDRAGARYVGLRFAPGVGPSVFGVPAHELCDQRVPLSAIWPDAVVRRLVDLALAGHLGDVARALEKIALDRLGGAPATGFDRRTAVEMLRRGDPVASVATAVGMSERQLRRCSIAAFGYGPKTLARVLRLNRALDLARAGVPLASVAATAGYADQTHLAHDVRSLVGEPMRAILAG